MNDETARQPIRLAGGEAVEKPLRGFLRGLPLLTTAV